MAIKLPHDYAIGKTVIFTRDIFYWELDWNWDPKRVAVKAGTTGIIRGVDSVRLGWSKRYVSVLFTDADGGEGLWHVDPEWVQYAETP